MSESSDLTQATGSPAAAAVGPLLKRGAFAVLEAGALAFLLWGMLTLLLCPVWGQCLRPLSARITEEAAFLRSQGLFPSDSLRAFENVGFARVCGAGSLYGFFFFSPPLALLLAAASAAAAWPRRLRTQILLRTALSLLVMAALSPMIWSYAGSLWWFLWAAAVILLLPPLVHGFLEGLRAAPWQGGRTKLLICLVSCAVMLAPAFTHPAWSVLFLRKSFAGMDSLTLVRDWLLLGPDGRGVINSWYYDNSPYAAEHTRITVFQPSVIGLFGPDHERWRKIVISERYQTPGETAWHERSLRAHFLACPDLDTGLDWLKKERIDLLLLHYETVKAMPGFRELASTPGLALLSDDDAAPPFFNGAPVIARNRFHDSPPVVERTGETVRPTVLTRRISELKKRGFFPEQEALFVKFRSIVFDRIFGRRSIAIPLLAICLGGAALYALLLLAAFGKRIPYLAVILCVCLLPWSAARCMKHATAWRALLKERPLRGESPYSDILLLHKACESSEAKDGLLREAETVLSGPVSDDRRIAMWQASLLGKAYQHMTPSGRKLTESFLSPLAGEYHELPMNFRYKLVECLARIPAMRPALEELVREEKHLYVRWYAESSGFGIGYPPR